METSSALLALSVGNSPVTGEFPTQRPVTQSFDVFFDLHLNQQLNKQWRHQWFVTLSRSLCHCNVKNIGELQDQESICLIPLILPDPCILRYWPVPVLLQAAENPATSRPTMPSVSSVTMPRYFPPLHVEPHSVSQNVTISQQQEWLLKVMNPVQRRSKDSTDKEFVCPEPGCGKTFFKSFTMYRHQRMANHGNLDELPKRKNKMPKGSYDWLRKNWEKYVCGHSHNSSKFYTVLV